MVVAAEGPGEPSSAVLILEWCHPGLQPAQRRGHGCTPHLSMGPCPGASLKSLNFVFLSQQYSLTQGSTGPLDISGLPPAGRYTATGLPALYCLKYQKSPDNLQI